MPFEKINHLNILSSVNYAIAYEVIDMLEPFDNCMQHTHAEYEIYVNLSGEVSFICGNTLYPVAPGNVVINRPGEPHHCIYRGNGEDTLNKLYYMLFTCPDGEPLLDIFNNRPAGERNLVILSEADSAALMELCERLIQRQDEPTLQNCYDFIRLLMLLNHGTTSSPAAIPVCIRDALAYISRHVSDTFSVKELAAAVHMSLSTFERHFRTHIGMPPKQYILQRKLALAADKLGEGYSVSEVFEACGFADYSHFISLFGKRFGMTPLAYRRSRQEKRRGDPAAV